MPTRDELLQQLYSMDHGPDENDRRRRIARRLRASGIETRVWCAPASAQDTLDDIVCATDFESSEAKTIQEHLADLIEPEHTYRMDTVRSNAVHLLRFYEKEELLQLEPSPGKEDLFAERMEQVASLTGSEAKTIYGRLADLIEPERTMSPIYRTSDYFECPLCGHDTLNTMYWATSDDGRQVVGIKQVLYCGHCGAKVVWEQE